MNPTPDIWYWLAGAIFIVAVGLLTLFLRKINEGVKDMKDKVEALDGCVDQVKKDLSGFTAGCHEKHKNIDLSLAEGRTKFESINELIREEVRSINASILALGQMVGELKGSIDTAVKLTNSKGKTA